MFTVLDHPLVEMKMTTLRDQRTPPQQFRRTLHEIAGLMAFMCLPIYAVMRVM